MSKKSKLSALREEYDVKRKALWEEYFAKKREIEDA